MQVLLRKCNQKNIEGDTAAAANPKTGTLIKITEIQM